ncbi:MAG: phosphatase PAP2 family protein [Cytophagaceae bacterium]|nr:MAG: phosphatase PAP2 family protein [Cytophagaceae bacterium]
MVHSSPTGRWLVPLLSVAYLLFSYFLIGFRPEQLVLVALCNGCYFLSATTRRFITGFSIFVVFWVLYDYMRAFPNYAYRAVDVAGLYHAEQHLFGIRSGGQLLTPNEFFLAHHRPALDVLCGLFYLCWHVFQSIYAKNANVFAAMPSLHSAYPVVVLFYSFKNKTRFLPVIFSLIMVGIWFAAVYTSHHYLLDVLAGVAVALAGTGLLRLLLARSAAFRRLLDAWVRATAPARAPSSFLP